VYDLEVDEWDAMCALIEDEAREAKKAQQQARRR
jgi:hypothetical protein